MTFYFPLTEEQFSAAVIPECPDKSGTYNFTMDLDLFWFARESAGKVVDDVNSQGLIKFPYVICRATLTPEQLSMLVTCAFSGNNPGKTLLRIEEFTWIRKHGV